MSLIGPFLYALTNHIDKFLLENYFRDHGVVTLILFSSILSAAGLPVLFFLDPLVLDVDIVSIAWLSVVGALNILILWAYLMALKDDEPTVVIIYYSLVPVLGGIFGFQLLGEVLTARQIFAMAIVIAGTSFVSIEFSKDERISFRWNTVLFMLMATTAWALEATIFKVVALEETVWRSMFWEHVSLVCFGLLIASAASTHRSRFLRVWSTNSARVLGLNGVNEAIYMVGNAMVSYAMLLAPVAVVLLAQSFQPIFVFLIGALLTSLFPQFFDEKLTKAVLLQKVTAIILSGTGAYILVLSTP